MSQLAQSATVPHSRPWEAPQAEISISVIVPVTERPESLVQLYQEFAEPLRNGPFDFEFIFIAEPWLRDLTAPLRGLTLAGEPVRVLDAGVATGEGLLLRAASEFCRGEIIVTLPCYRRVQPAALVELIRQVQAGADLAIARRWPRRDPWINRLQARVLHSLLGRMSGGGIHDVACGVRAMRRDVLAQLPLYGDFYRFLPVIALREGFSVLEIPAAQHTQDLGRRVYGPGTYLRRMLDLLGLFFLVQFREKPLRFFGLAGSALSCGGAAVLAVVFVQRLGGQGLANRPILLLGVLLVVLGVQAIALGLIGEIIVHLHAPMRSPYRLRRAGDARDVSSG
ncbi:MAG: hypothetical protein ACRENI_09270 [Gemmatimonadaceae bacterium]